MPGVAFLRGDRITLRTVETEHLPFIRRNVNDPDVRRPLHVTTPTNLHRKRESFEENSEDDDSVRLVVHAGDEPVGYVSLGPIDRERTKANLGYWIAPEAQGDGYATEAVELVVDYAFDELRLHKVYAKVFDFNPASMRVLEKAGFTEEGVHRDAAFIDGAYRDDHQYGILEDER